MLSGIAPLAAMLFKMCNDGVTTTYMICVVALAVYAYPYFRGFAWMLKHYHLPFNDAFNLCVMDLRHLAFQWHTTYQIVDLLIFVLAFLALLGLNGYITYLILY